MRADFQDEALDALLACPLCKGSLVRTAEQLSCAGCGLDFGSTLDLRPPSSTEAAGSFPLIPGSALSFAQTFPAVQPLLGALSGRVLDIGGSGFWIEPWANAAGPVVVLHPAAEDLRRVWETPRTNGGKAPSFVCGLPEYLPFAGASFDAVLALIGLEYLHDPERVFREVFRVLRPGGRFIALLQQTAEAGVVAETSLAVPVRTCLDVAKWRQGMFKLRNRSWKDGRFILDFEREGVPVSSLPAEAQVQAEPPAVASPGSARVSVIIPCFNQGRFLADSIRSAEAQGYADLEIVVVDDGSTDDTATVAARHPGIRYVRQENQGLAAARNAGLRASSGNYVIFLDADDRLLPNALQIGVDSLRAHPDCGFVYGHCTLISSDGIPLFTPHQAAVTENWYVRLLEQCFVWTPGTVMFSREALRALGDFDISVSPTADYDMYLRTSRHFPIHCHEQVVLEYRQHGSNMSGNCDLMLESVLPVLSRQYPHVRGDAVRELAWRAGLRNYRLFYSDPFVREARQRSGGRIRQLDAELAGELDALRRAALIDEWKQVYGWAHEAFQIRRAVASPDSVKADIQPSGAPPFDRGTGEPLAVQELSSASASDRLLVNLEEQKAQLRTELEGSLQEVQVLRRELRQSEQLRSAAAKEAADLEAIAQRALETEAAADALRDLKVRLSEVRARWAAIREVWAAVERLVPPRAHVIVVSKGDDEFLRVGDRQLTHFPHEADGRYAGYHPNDSAEAIEQLEAARRRGAEYLVFPSTSFWWLEYYKEFAQHLACNHAVLGSGNQFCLLFRLKDHSA